MAFLPEKYNINVLKKTTITPSHALGLCMDYSAYGFDWALEPTNPVSTIWGSEVITMLWDQESERNVIYGRAHYAAETGNPGANQWFVRHSPSQPFGWIPKPAVYRIESEDLISIRCGCWHLLRRCRLPSRLAFGWPEPGPGHPRSGFHWATYRREDCDRFTGDAVNHLVSWNGNTAVNRLVGYTRFRFYMRNGELFSDRIADE